MGFLGTSNAASLGMDSKCTVHSVPFVGHMLPTPTCFSFPWCSFKRQNLRWLVSSSSNLIGYFRYSQILFS